MNQGLIPAHMPPALPVGRKALAATSVGYLINQYPKVSHSFIRREILALQALGQPVSRIALRGWDAKALDESDRQEQLQTRYVLQGGAWPLVQSTLMRCIKTPHRLWQAMMLVSRFSRMGSRHRAWVHWVYLAEACLVARWLEESSVHHLHAHFGTNAAEVAMLCSLLSGLPYSFTVHGPEEFDHPQAIGLAEKCQRAAFVVAISSFGRSQIYRWLDSAQWPKVKVVHCGVDASFLDQPPPATSTSARLVCIGRLCEQKGQLLLLHAARRVVDTGAELQLVLAGDGEMRPEIEALIDSLQLRNHVSVTGWIDGQQVRSELSMARALVLASFAEGLPVVLMEAMAMARPVLSTSIAGIPELVVDGECGWLVPAGDVERLADAMLECLRTDAPTLHAMGQKARARCQARHDVQVQASQLAALFSGDPKPS